MIADLENAVEMAKLEDALHKFQLTPIAVSLNAALPREREDLAALVNPITLDDHDQDEVAIYLGPHCETVNCDSSDDDVVEVDAAPVDDDVQIVDQDDVVYLREEIRVDANEDQ
jgi:hypothetical protein